MFYSCVIAQIIDWLLPVASDCLFSMVKPYLIRDAKRVTAERVLIVLLKSLGNMKFGHEIDFDCFRVPIPVGCAASGGTTFTCKSSKAGLFIKIKKCVGNMTVGRSHMKSGMGWRTRNK